MKKKSVCADCGNDYEAEMLNFVGIERAISPYCYKCRNKKRKELDELERKERLRQELDHYNLWVKQSGIPVRYYNKGFDQIEDQPGSNIIKITELCREYADQFPMLRQIDYYSIALISENVWGVGKTHLACAIAQSLMNRWNKISKSPVYYTTESDLDYYSIALFSENIWGVGKTHLACATSQSLMNQWNKITKCPVYYTTESDLMLRIRSTYNKNGSETEGEIYDQITRVPLLILDDVGKEEVADPRFVQRVWFHMINERYNNMLPVVITANLNEDGLAKHLGGNRGNEAVYDRLQEMLKNGIYKVIGKSYRYR